MSDRIAAIAPVSGAPATIACVPTRPVPVLHIHGTDDKVAPYHLPDVPKELAAWAARDACTPSSRERSRQGDARCEIWDGCRAGSEVILCTIDGGGHTWPGGAVDLAPMGKTSRDIDATDAIWQFFSKHPMPES
jgi:polyhydroxybutyrate depolymerase